MAKENPVKRATDTPTPDPTDERRDAHEKPAVAGGSPNPRPDEKPKRVAGTGPGEASGAPPPVE